MSSREPCRHGPGARVAQKGPQLSYRRSRADRRAAGPSGRGRAVRELVRLGLALLCGAAPVRLSVVRLPRSETQGALTRAEGGWRCAHGCVARSKDR